MTIQPRACGYTNYRDQQPGGFFGWGTMPGEGPVPPTVVSEPVPARPTPTPAPEVGGFFGWGVFPGDGPVEPIIIA